MTTILTYFQTKLERRYGRGFDSRTKKRSQKKGKAQ